MSKFFTHSLIKALVYLAFSLSVVTAGANDIVKLDTCSGLLTALGFPLKLDENALRQLVSTHTIPTDATFTPEAIKWLEKTRDAVRTNTLLAEQRVVGSSGIFRMELIRRIMESNSIYLGEPGIGKTRLSEFVAEQEDERAFKFTFDINSPESLIKGGLDGDAYQKGATRFNTKGSAVEAKTFIFDEVDKAGPGLFSALVAVLEKQRIIWFGMQDLEVAVRTKSGILISNATPAQLLKNYNDLGQVQLPKANFSRVPFKAYFPRWLNAEDGVRMDQINRDANFMRALGHWLPEMKTDYENSRKPQILDFDGLLRMSELLFSLRKTTQDMGAMMVNTLRRRVIDMKKIKNAEDNREMPFLPDFDPSPRSRKEIETLIKVSALIDFLLSPLADDLKNLRVIELSPISLWRMHYFFSSTGAGKPATIDVGQDSIGIKYNYGFEETEAEDALMEQYFSDQRDQQEMFRSELINTTNSAKQALMDIFKALGGVTAAKANAQRTHNMDFEGRIFLLNQP